MSKEKIPNPHELEKELNEYLSKKYGDRVRLSVPFLFPDHESFKSDQGASTQSKSHQVSAPSINFSMRPSELESYLNEYVIKQESAKEILATKICTHFNRMRQQVRYPGPGNIKNNILMIGPTGVGKTFLIKLIAQKIGVPFVKGDATKFSETGYVGGDVEDLVRDLVREANGDILRAQYGIIYIDEIDKIASSKNTWGLDVSRTGVQRALLKPMEETEVDLKVPHDLVSQMEALEDYRKTGRREKRTINTKNILFIFSGAFNDLEDIIERRLNRQGIGFGAHLRSKDRRTTLLPLVKAEDLVEYGFESEFIGRIPVIATFEQLQVDDLYTILNNPNSTVINSKKQDFMAYGIDIRFEDGALRRIAELAYDEKTGARGLISIVEKVLIKYEKTLPSTNIKKLVVTRRMVDHPLEEFANILTPAIQEQMTVRHAELVRNEQTVLKKRLYEIINSLDASVRFLVADPYIDTVVKVAVEKCRDYRAVLEEAALVYDEIREFEKAFQEQYGITISFDEQAVNKIMERVFEEEHDTGKFLSELFTNYQHGLKLVQERTGCSSFVLTEKTIENPQEFLNSLIKETYH
ncbi:MAG: AAA family ATPase [Desulfobacterota bacterium]|nr:AAA family ATPase [Thermodesulfobacteriota bacterium]